ncbi:hypothetical protein Emag_006658 [Eimeria magna]
MNGHKYMQTPPLMGGGGSLETERKQALGVAGAEEAPVFQGDGVVKRQEEGSPQRKYSRYWFEVNLEQEAPVHPRHSPTRIPPSPQRRLPKEHQNLKAHTQEIYPMGSGCGDDNSLRTCHKEVADDEAHRYQGYQQGAEQPKGEDEVPDNLDVRGISQLLPKKGSPVSQHQRRAICGRSLHPLEHRTQHDTGQSHKNTPYPCYLRDMSTKGCIPNDNETQDERERLTLIQKNKTYEDTNEAEFQRIGGDHDEEKFLAPHGRTPSRDAFREESTQRASKVLLTASTRP